MTLPRVRSFSLPEHADYSSIDGCEVSDSCHSCPLPICKHDTPLSAQERTDRNLRIFELRKRGMPIPELMRAFEISSRTVHRIMEHKGRATMYRQTVGPADEPPLIDASDLKMHDFKLRDKTAPAFRQRLSAAIYRHACPRCEGAVEVDFMWRGARCLSCGWDTHDGVTEAAG